MIVYGKTEDTIRADLQQHGIRLPQPEQETPDDCR